MAAIENTSVVSTKIIVSNIPASVSEDHFINFFECGITNHKIIFYGPHLTQNNAYIITFETDVDVASLQEECEKKPLKEQILHVQSFDEPEDVSQPQAGGERCGQFCSEVVVSGLPDKVSDDYLLNWLECQLEECRVSVCNIKHGSRQGVALVVFDKPVDPGKLQKVCNDNMVEDTKLQIKTVDTRGAILIRNPHPEIVTNSFKFYLSNTRRSGGSKEVQVERDEHNKFLIAYFESKEVAERVASKEDHLLDKKKLELELFHLDLDSLQSDVPLSSDHSKAPVNSLSEPSAHAQSFTANKAAGELFGGVEQTDVPANLPHESEKCDELTKSFVHVSLKDAGIETRHVRGLHWLYIKVVDTFSDFLSDACQGLKIEVEEEGNHVKLTGHKDAVERMEKLLTSFTHKQTQSKYLNDIGRKFGGWDVIFEEQIQDRLDKYYLDFAKDFTQQEELYIGIQGVQSKPMSIDQFLEMFVSRKEVATVETKVHDDLVNSTTWAEFTEKEIGDKYGEKIQTELEGSPWKIWVLGSVEHLTDAAVEVEMFIHNTPDEKTIPLSSKQVSFLRRFCSKTLDPLHCEAGLGFAEIEITGSSCHIKGYRTGVKRAAKKIQEILEGLKCKRAIFTHPKLQTILHTSGWERVKEDAEKEFHCLITELPDRAFLDSDDDDDGEWGQWRATLIQSFGLSDQAGCHVVHGNVEDMKVDAVVHCSRQQNAGGGMPRSVAPSGQGKGAYPKRHPSSMRGNQLSTPGTGLTLQPSGALPCKSVIDVNIYHYFHTEESYEHGLHQLVADIVQMCEIYHLRSVALPLLGSDVQVGQTSYPIDRVAKALKKTLSKCWNLASALSDPDENTRGQPQSLCNVFLCTTRAACVRGLIDALEESPLSPLASPDICRYMSCVAARSGGKSLEDKAITVMPGDISKVTADVLVVPLDIDLDLDLNKSKITRSLVHEGGGSVQHSLQHGMAGFWEDKSVSDQDDYLGEHRVLSGKPGYNARAKCIYYVYLPPWGPDVLDMLTTIVRRCLHKASADKFKSLAIPALGVGRQLGYPPDFVARASLGAVSDFLEHEKTTVENVKFVIFRSDTSSHMAFGKEHIQWFTHRVLKNGVHPRESSVDAQDYSQTSGKVHGFSYAAAASGASSGAGHRGRSGGYAPQDKTSIKIGKITLCVKRGDLLQEHCSVLVNSTNEELDFDKGGVAGAFKRKCGDELCRLCEEQKKTMKKRGFIVTNAPSLYQCSNIIHLDLGRYLKEPEETLKKCLNKIKDTHPSVAFPALGTGEAKERSPEDFARHLVSSVKALKKPKKLEKVHVVANGHCFQHLAATVKSLDPSDSRPAARTSAAADSSSRKSETERSVEHAGKQSVCMKGYDHDFTTATQAVSLYIFSDSKKHRQGAKDKIAARIVEYLGPVKKTEDKKPQVSSGHDTGSYAWLSSWNYYVHK